MANQPVKVLIVDDSVFFRTSLQRVISQNKDIQIVGCAGDAYEARDKILELRPDVMTLDVEMPKMNGIDFLRRLIPQYPIPCVVVSAAPLSAFDAVDAGAVDYVRKPQIKSPEDLQNFADELTEKIITAKSARIMRRKPRKTAAQGGNDYRPIASYISAAENKGNSFGSKDAIIALGASTGGTEALQVVIQGLPENSPPIVVVQHMPPVFTKMYAERLNKNCKVEVKEAEDGERLRRGLCIIAAGEHHLRLKKDANGYFITSTAGQEKVSGHCPSVDVLFDSVAEVAGKNTVAALLTGMGSDGANGLLKIKNAGGYTIGQNKETCVVYGMPMVAFNIGAVNEQAPLSKVADIICRKIADK